MNLALDLCECRCWAPHRKSGCTGLDSYGIPCTCPSFEPLSDDDEEDEDGLCRRSRTPRTSEM